MSNKTRILVTGAGAPGTRGTLFALKHGAQREHLAIDIVGSDQDPSKSYKSGFSRIVELPPGYDPTYLDALASSVAAFGIDVVLPQTTAEVAILSRHSSQLPFRVAVASSQAIERANNKAVVTDLFYRKGWGAPKFRLTTSQGQFVSAINELGFPESDLVVKLLSASGGRGVRILTARQVSYREFSLEKPTGMNIRLPELLGALELAPSWPELLVTERILGPEISVDCYIGPLAQYAVPRARTQIRTGISTITDLVDMPDLADVALAAGQELGLTGAYGLQFMIDEATPKVIECNPRVQGTMVASLMRGVNPIWATVRDALELPPQKPEVLEPFSPGRLVRSWAASLESTFLLGET